MDEINKALEGELSEDQLKEFESKLSEEGKKLFQEAQAFKAKRQDEESKGKNLTDTNTQLETKQKELQDKIKADEETLNSLKQSTSQFRDEQIGKAQKKFFEEYKISEEDQAKYLDTFKKLDSGKIDPDLIFQDFVGVYAFLNKDSLLNAEEMRKKQEASATAINASEAGGQQTPPEGEAKKDFSEDVLAYAKRANISPEDAQRQVTEGMVRKYQ